MTIKVSKAKKDLDIPIGLRLRLFLNSFYIDRVYYNTIRGLKKIAASKYKGE